jgi:hypothetical protein
VVAGGQRGSAGNEYTYMFSPLHAVGLFVQRTPSHPQAPPPHILLLYTFFATASEFSRCSSSSSSSNSSRSIIVITIIICLHQPVKLAKNYSISTATVDSFVKNVRICLNIIQSLKAYRRSIIRTTFAVHVLRARIYITRPRVYTFARRPRLSTYQTATKYFVQ